LRDKRLQAIVILVLLWGALPSASAAKTTRYAFRSIYVFENRGDDPLTLSDDDATIIIFESNEWQTVTIRNSTHGVAREYTDVDGNSLAVMDFPGEIPAGGALFFSYEYVIDAGDSPRPSIDPQQSGGLSDIPEGLLEEYCGETETFRRSEEMMALAGSLTSDEATVLGKVTRVLGWIVENVTYGNYEVPQYPDETLEQRRGDCDDQSILLISMLRALGVPALLQIGVVFSNSIEGDRTSWDGHLSVEQRGIGWHGWAMVYIPPWGWLPIDLTLTGSKDPLTIIAYSPEYESYVVTAYNVSNQQYIGDSRSSRERIIASDLYVSVSDIVLEEAEPNNWIGTAYMISGILAGAAFLIYLVHSRRHR
jgi:transglutaminase-like putative cysteine protease